ncbi:Gfo/Idh/MocA family protein [Brachybacterium sp. sponge]|uniref:Gfo/Idh/MocA family protein n=1 Tax=Brachybacterium sp. sponge TaxID=1775432 RepID=UPI0007A3B61E|nr:Gfo/Idh/MocA family oxidoreductase [Brachybacterium sp. sponge]
MSGPATGTRPAAGTDRATGADRATWPVPAAGSASATAAAAPVRIALIGTRGFGRVHLENLERLREVGRAELIGVVDLHEPPAAVQGIWHRDLASLLAAHADAPPEVVVIATPIDTHLPLALQALEAGAHVYLEKPPVPALADHAVLERAAEAAGRVVQIGFQARGGAGVDALRDLVATGELGEIDTVRVHGAWSRDRAYYRRSPWAGRRRLGGRRVADGVATNPLAHAVHAGLVVAGIDRLEDIAAVTTELRRAHDIEADDTAFVRIDPVRGAADADLGEDAPSHAAPSREDVVGARSRPAVVCALTTTAPVQAAPWIEIVGPRGTARLSYTEDVLRRTDPDGTVTETRHERTDLVENLLAHVRDPQVALLCPLAATAPFSAVLEAIQSAPDPAPIAPEHVTWLGEGEAARPVVDGIEEALTAALETGAPFSRSGATWACEDAIATWRPETVAPLPADASPTAAAPASPSATAPAPQAAADTTTTTGSRADGRDALDEETRS